MGYSCQPAAAYRLAAKLKFTGLSYTHISARVPGTGDPFLINPQGRFFDEITASSLATINASGNPIGDSDSKSTPQDSRFIARWTRRGDGAKTLRSCDGFG